MNSLETGERDSVSELARSLEHVHSRDDFECWVRQELRRVVPHAMFLATLGRLFNLGSLATHRIGVDFPLNLVEALKSCSGALDDPLMVRWFKSGKTSHINLSGHTENASSQTWRSTMLRYGIRGVSIHGILDHATRRFAAFELANLSDGRSVRNVTILNELSLSLSKTAWRVIENGSARGTRDVIFQPTLGLTVTELHIIELLAQGLSNKEIARRRGVSDSTVKTQVQRTGAKLGATRRAEIVAIALPMMTALPAQAVIDQDGF